ncbi:upstream-binding factor 1-like protein 1 isoform X1 [Epinephelus fuscoguttatus]|uniref:upstream-binding factor 1-like protein 1 isoform X1 n=1 Tax=Epinephelus fuscoguttatus TaxID=293821 RepID=UPI0020D1A709|nr:upstream-binding factor 1-like protein 1 isoform X1 [Epinephelus fuscoguttatus]
MSSSGAESEETEWTKANLQKLLAAIKTNIPDRERMTAYPKGLKSVNWDKVAFPPFSPKACQEKWMQIFQKMRKIRTLTELIDEAEGVVSNPVPNSKIHPELPKRPGPPNSIFYEENWAKFHEKHPNMSRKKLFKRVLKKYQALPDEEKDQYVEKFKVAKEEYNRRMLEFSKHYTEDPKHKYKKHMKRKRVTADAPDQDKQESKAASDLPPKPPFNGYNLFCKEQRASTTGFSGNNYVSMWAQRWRDLTEQQKDEYTTRCKELQRQYSAQLSDYLNKFDAQKQQQILDENGLKAPKMRRGTRKRTKDLPGEPRKPSQCGNAVFFQTQMERLKDKIPNSRERFTKVSQLWHGLSDKEKEHYKQEVQKNIQKYKMELRKWFKTLTATEQAAYRKHNSSKLKFLDVKPTEDDDDREGARVAVHRPSDSEDEDIEYISSSSSDEEEDFTKFEIQELEEDDDDVIMFKVY